MVKELKNAFKNRDFFLPEDAIVKKENGEWVITDKEKKEIYSIRKADCISVLLGTYKDIVGKSI